MSSPSHVADTPITDRDQLVGNIASGEKPKAQWRIGTEHEKFGFRLVSSTTYLAPCPAPAPTAAPWTR